MEVGPVDRLPSNQLCHQAHAGKFGQSRQVLGRLQVSVDDQPTGATVEHASEAFEIDLL